MAKNSNKTGLWILVILVILGVAAYYIFANNAGDLQGKFNFKAFKAKPEVIELQPGS